MVENLGTGFRTKTQEVNQSSTNYQHANHFALTMVWLTPLLIMAFLVVACTQISNQVFNKKLTAGEIIYEISFPDAGPESITASLLPDRMSYTFSETGFATHFESAGGVFQNRIIADETNRTLHHQVKVFRKKIEVKMDETGVMKRLAERPKTHVIHTAGVDTIAGYPCKKAVIVFEDVDRPDMEVYYTDKIKMKSPNWCTEYHEIDGVLLAYEVEEFGIRMRLRATSIRPLDTPAPQEQALPDYTLVTEEVMDVEINQLKETFEL